MRFEIDIQSCLVLTKAQEVVVREGFILVQAGRRGQCKFKFLGHKGFRLLVRFVKTLIIDIFH